MYICHKGFTAEVAVEQTLKMNGNLLTREVERKMGRKRLRGMGERTISLKTEKRKKMVHCREWGLHRILITEATVIKCSVYVRHRTVSHT